ncbi:MAG: hypothetical protein IJG13_10985 [Kiritimatiellae bacterium]|nr:hypothetical protein [Kiritimatiellia bacterium]MBQ3345052.1 hypothetical protein [Kiritimatiellia bacterium]
MKRLIPLVAAAILSGCWTFGTSEYPETQVSSAPAATNVTVAVSGFSAVLTGYRDLVSFNTVYVPGGYGYRRCYPGYVATVPTHTYIPEAQTTDRYRLRAVDAFERAGYAVGAAVPDWTVEVTFAGPVVTSGDSACEAAWMLCTLFFCDYSASSWTAKLRVRDNRTGRLVFHRDYMQRYETKVFGLIPLFGISACDETSYSYMQGWCLSALTDRAVADATAFLSSARRPAAAPVSP